MRTYVLIGVLLALNGCASLPADTVNHRETAQQSVSVAVKGPGVPLELHWYRNSAERRAIYTEIYQLAGDSINALAKGRRPQSWAIVLDVDETILDNSTYQARLAASGQSYTAVTWAAWVHDKAAVALPGAVRFIHMIRSDLQGRVVLITNRSMADCADTEANLREQAIEYDAILCAPDGKDAQPVADKNPRFDLVKRGGTPVGVVDVLAYIGDNIQDFPRLTQSDSGDGSHFGKDYFVLPNPMYGSWAGNVYR